MPKFELKINQSLPSTLLQEPAGLLHPPAESSCDHPKSDQPNTVNLSSFTSEQFHFMQQHLQATTKSSKTFLPPHTIIPFLFVFLFSAGSLSQSPSSLYHHPPSSGRKKTSSPALALSLRPGRHHVRPLQPGLLPCKNPLPPD